MTFNIFPVNTFKDTILLPYVWIKEACRKKESKKELKKKITAAICFQTNATEKRLQKKYYSFSGF